LINIAISAISTSIALKVFGDMGVAIAIGIGTFLILIFGEIFPKSLAVHFAEPFSLMASRPLNLFAQIVRPAQKILTKLAEKIISLVGIQPVQEDSTITDDEFRTMVEMGEGEGVIDAEERALIHNVMEFGEKSISDVMTPKVDMFTLSVNDKMEDILPKILENFYSRVPVYDLDGETIAGILLTKDLNRFRHLPSDKFNLKSILQPLITVPGSKKIKDMLQEFKKQKRHMAVVFDEYGSISGLVTMEDILEEVVGEIDSEMRPEETLITKLSEKRFRISGTCSIAEFNEKFQCQLPNGDITTLGGFVFGLFERIPRSGETIQYENFKFRVEKMKGARILSLHLTLNPPKPETAKEVPVEEEAPSP
jgi:CBS domain containing-hemolysin-like protein